MGQLRATRRGCTIWRRRHNVPRSKTSWCALHNSVLVSTILVALMFADGAHASCQQSVEETMRWLESKLAQDSSWHAKVTNSGYPASYSFQFCYEITCEQKINTTYANGTSSETYFQIEDLQFVVGIFPRPGYAYEVAIGTVNNDVRHVQFENNMQSQVRYFASIGIMVENENIAGRLSNAFNCLVDHANSYRQNEPF